MVNLVTRDAKDSKERGVESASIQKRASLPLSCPCNEAGGGPPPYNPLRAGNDSVEGTRTMAHWRRTHTCGELREAHIGQTVVLNGWVNTYRAYNDQVFVDLRDRYGLTQIVFEAEGDQGLFAAA